MGNFQVLLLEFRADQQTASEFFKRILHEFQMIKLLFFKFLNSVRAEFSAVWTQVTTHTSGISNFKKKICAPSSISFRLRLALPHDQLWKAICFSDQNVKIPKIIPVSSINSERKGGKHQMNCYQRSLWDVFATLTFSICFKFYNNSLEKKMAYQVFI